MAGDEGYWMARLEALCALVDRRFNVRYYKHRGEWQVGNLVPDKDPAVLEDKLLNRLEVIRGR